MEQITIEIREDGGGIISGGGGSIDFQRIGADAAEQIGFDYSKKLRVEVYDAERYSVHGGRLDYD